MVSLTHEFELGAFLHCNPSLRQILVQPILYGTVIPLVGYFTFKKLILDPMEERRRVQERERQMEAAREKVAEARKEAAASIDLMRERFNRIRHDEASRGGLVIVAAVYGKLLDGESNGHYLRHLQSREILNAARYK